MSGSRAWLLSLSTCGVLMTPAAGMGAALHPLKGTVVAAMPLPPAQMMKLGRRRLGGIRSLAQ